jgi:hypothetical protein
LLPDCYRTSQLSVYGGAYRGVNLRRGVFLHPGQDVAVEVEGYAHSRMPKAFLRDLRVDAVREKMGRMRMPKVMKSYAAQIARLCEDTQELMGKTVRLQGAPVLSGYKIGLIGDPDAYLQKLFGLLGAASPQLLDH